MRCEYLIESIGGQRGFSGYVEDASSEAVRRRQLSGEKER